LREKHANAAVFDEELSHYFKLPDENPKEHLWPVFERAIGNRGAILGFAKTWERAVHQSFLDAIADGIINF